MGNDNAGFEIASSGASTSLAKTIYFHFLFSAVFAGVNVSSSLLGWVNGSFAFFEIASSLDWPMFLAKTKKAKTGNTRKDGTGETISNTSAVIARHMQFYGSMRVRQSTAG